MQVQYTVKNPSWKFRNIFMKARTFYIPEFFNFKLLIPEYSPIYRCWFQTAVYFFYSV
jgi:hypothetical protein